MRARIISAGAPAALACALVVACVATLVGCGSNAAGTTVISADNIAAAPTVTVTANSEVKTTPDKAKIAVSVTTQGETATGVQNENADLVNKVFEALSTMGVPDKSVQTADKERVRSNLDGIEEELTKLDPDVIFLQEVDRDSARAHHTDEMIDFVNAFIEDDEPDYTSAFAYNMNVLFIPYPIPPIGPVRSGIMTLTRMHMASAERIQLPCPFKWPVRPANFKRCLLIERLPVQNSEKELVLINLHLDAYDDGKGKEEQTEALEKILEEERSKGNYVIAAGDFNQAFSNTDISAYPLQEGKWAPGLLSTEGLEKEWQCLMDSSTPTCRSLDQPYEGADHSSFQYYVVDGYILSSNIEVISCGTQDLGFVYTDHNPVLLECVLKQ